MSIQEPNAETTRRLLGLEEHFEGGFFKECWRSRPKHDVTAAVDGRPRSISTSIYYMMNKGQTLCWHRLRGDNIHTWHYGGSLTLYIFDPCPHGSCTKKVLGNPFVDPDSNFQVSVPGGHWYAAEVNGDPEYTVWGEIVTPANVIMSIQEPNAETTRRLLGLEEHFEGGFFKECWRSRPKHDVTAAVDGRPRSISTSIYYMMNKGQTLCWHRLRGDNIHTWHYGGSLTLYIFDPCPHGSCTKKVLGNPFVDPDSNFQVSVPGGHWYAAEVNGDPEYTVWGEIVTPANVIMSIQEPNAETTRRLLGLEEHFEGGFFKECWRSRPKHDVTAAVDGRPRSISTSIYYMMNKGQTLCWHRLRGDNIHTWHYGGSLTLYIFDPCPHGSCTKKVLGNPFVDPDSNFQVSVPGGHWYAAEVNGDPEYTVWGEIVTPGWEMEDYEDGSFSELSRLYPDNIPLIQKFLVPNIISTNTVIQTESPTTLHYSL